MVASIERYVVQVVEHVARNLEGTTSLSSATPTGTAPPSATSSSAATNSSPQSSPLLFFVALGFGVVFTNLWIIVGVKYCFRYNARNRARQDDNGDPIDLTTMPPRHRRRREKKLMSMDEVNERFPILKYKAWLATRAEQALSSTPDPDKAESVKDAEARPPFYDATASTSEEATRPTTAHSSPQLDVEKREHTELDGAAAAVAVASSPVDTEHTHIADPAESHLHELKTVASTIPGENDGGADADADEEDEDDHIQTAIPAEMLATPADTCAICIDTLEEDDDVRGLSCGHAFHASCVDPWLTSRRACCPLCKADYYVPKPRPEGEPATDAERSAASRRATAAMIGTGNERIGMPLPPQLAFIGRAPGSGSGAQYRSRMLLLPGRFTPMQATAPNRTLPSRAPWSRPRRTQLHSSPISTTAATATTTATAPADPAVSQQQTSWRDRFLPGASMWRHNQNDAAENSSSTAPEVHTGAAPPTPSQLEAGTVTA